jgi:VWFA-related protein
MWTLYCTLWMITQVLAGMPSSGLSTTWMPAIAPALVRCASADKSPQQARATAQESFSLKVNVDLVTVAAVVRDKQGGFVCGLGAGDFVVSDNGIAQQVTHFSRDQLPLAVALLVDRSPSIEPYVQELHGAALAALEHLRTEDQVVLFSFDQCPARLNDLTPDRSQIARKIGELTVGTGTNIYETIVEAALYLHDNAPDRRRAIILISDNYSNTGRLTEKDALEEALETSTTLYSIRTPGRNPGAGDPGAIERIAKGTGGEVLKLGAEEKLAGALDNAIMNLRMGYTLGFAPGDATRAGFHKLVVKLKPATPCTGCAVQARSGYYVGPPAPMRTGSPVGASGQPYNCEEYAAEMQAQEMIAIAASLETDFHEIGFQVSAARATDADARPQVKAELRIDSRSVAFKNVNDLHTGKLRIALFCADSKGNYLGEDWKTLDMNLQEETYQRFLESGIPVSILIHLERLPQLLKVIVYDMSSGRVGSRVVRIN